MAAPDHTEPAIRSTAQTTGPVLEIEVSALDGQLKEGHVRQFTVMCDEAARTGGTDTAPPPLGYFTLGIGF